jgi:histidinol-phosphate aminotransferase
MLARLSPRTRMVFIANPNNPTGTIVNRTGFARFMERCGPETVVVLDEAYFEYVEDRDYPDALEYVRGGSNLVVLRTFSKIYALAGIRVGYAITRPEIAAAVHQVREPFNVNSLAQVAAVASLKDPGQVERARRLNAESQNYFLREFSRLGLESIPSCANFVMVDTRRDSRQVFEALVRRGVIVRTGDIFGMPTHIRVTTGLPDENRRFIEALEAALAEIPEVPPSARTAAGPAAVV